MTSFLAGLEGSGRSVSVELRPPRAALETAAGIDAWIDIYHAVRGLVRQDTSVFLTDSAVGSQEEDNLRHLAINLGNDVPRSSVVPFLTTKHSLEYCLAYADRAAAHGFPALVVLGGDKQIGPPRCVEHGWQLRVAIRERQPDLVLGGWANPLADPVRQVEYLLDGSSTADFFLTQIVSHHDERHIAAFLNEADRRGLRLPGVFGVFYYRSANPRTLRQLEAFLPVPREQLTAEFAAGATADEVCARTIRSLHSLGARHVYVSNLPSMRPGATLGAIRTASLVPD